MKKWFTLFLLALCISGIPVTAYAAEEAEPLTYDLSAFPAAYITNANLNLRAEPTTDSEKLETLSRGSIVWVTDFLDHEWFYVCIGEQNGYMKAEFLDEYYVSLPEAEIPMGTTADPGASFTPAYAETGIGTVELLDWSEAKELFTIGEPAQIIDVRTKTTYWVESFSNGKHADVESVTQDDTTAIKSTFGGRWDWEPRPILVIINGRTLAASINGMPHGGGVRNDNGMNGQICIHFKGSRTHNGNRSHENDHQNCVMEAFNTTKNW